MKRFLSLCLVLVMSLCLTTPGFAVDSYCGDEGIMPYAMPCPVCNGNVSVITEWNKKDICVGSGDCTHYPYGDDLFYEKRGTRTYSCVRCDYGYTVELVEPYTKCYGHYA